MSLHELTFLTIDNIFEFYDKIVNLNESRPENPANDLLAKFIAELPS
jgi:hypothetical protein